MLLEGRSGVDIARLIVSEEIVIGIRGIKRRSDSIYSGVTDRSGRKSLDRRCIVSAVVDCALSLADSRSYIIADV